MAVVTLDQLSLTDLVILTGAIVWVVLHTLDSLGWSRSSRSLREENLDVIRRNQELDEITTRQEEQIISQTRAIDSLSEKIAELEKRDQGAVLEALEDNQRVHGERHERSMIVLNQILSELRIQTHTNGGT